MVLALGSVAAAWIAAPVLDMTVRGTTDQRTLAGCRAWGHPTSATVTAIPAPRESVESTDRIPA